MMTMTEQKKRIREFWNQNPCRTRKNPFVPFTTEYFE